MAKILYIDIETSPNKGYFWRSGTKIFVPPEAILEERKIVCICYKWSDEDTVHFLKWTADQCDKKMLQKISKILLQADSIVGHNSDRFDIPWIMGRLFFHKLPPLGDLPKEDTYKQARKVFNTNSGKLDYLAKYAGVGGKVSTGGLPLWIDVCHHNDRQALKKMIDYCKNDVIILQGLHEEMLPYITPRQHMGIMQGGDRSDCPSCGSIHKQKRGTYITRVAEYQRYSCNDCGHRWRDTRMKKTTDKL